MSITTLFEEIESLRRIKVNIENRYTHPSLFTLQTFRVGPCSHRVQLPPDLNELNSGDLKIGTTKRGIGPTYASKMERYGVRMGALRNWDRFKEQYMRIYNIVRLV